MILHFIPHQSIHKYYIYILFHLMISSDGINAVFTWLCELNALQSFSYLISVDNNNLCSSQLCMQRSCLLSAWNVYIDSVLIWGDSIQWQRSLPSILIHMLVVTFAKYNFITLIPTTYKDTMTHTCNSQTSLEAKYAASIYLMINLSQMSQNELKCLVW